MPIRLKLALIAGLGLLAVLAVAVFSEVGMTTMKGLLLRTHEVSQALVLQGDADMMHDAIRADLLQLMLFQGNGSQLAGEEELEDHIQGLRKNYEQFAKFHLSDHTYQLIDKTRSTVEDYVSLASKMGKNTSYATNGVSTEEFQTFQSMFETLEKEMDEITQAIQEETDGANAEAHATLARTQLQISLVFLVAAALLIAVSWVVSVSIIAPLNLLVGMMDAMAEGDLTGELKKSKAVKDRPKKSYASAGNRHR